MATDYGVRQGLRESGYTDDDIGYDANTGYVQVKNKGTGMYENFIKPEMNVQGTTYTSRDNFNNALNRLRQGQQQQNAVVSAYGQPQTTAQSQTSPYVGTQPVNPADQQLMDLLGMVRSRITNPQPYDVYGSPEYQAAQQQSQYGAQQANRMAQEAYGEAGFGRSTNLGERIARNAAEANQRLMTQVVPQLIAQNRAQQQQELASYFPLINALATQQQTADLRQQRAIENRLTEGGLTGTLPYDPQLVASVQKQMAANSAAYASASPEEQKRLHEENVRLAASIGGTDITGSGDYTFSPGQRTVQGQQFDAEQGYREWQRKFQEGQATAEENRFWVKVQQDAQQFAAQQGLQWAQLDRQTQNDLFNQSYQKERLDLEKASSQNEMQSEFQNERKGLTQAIRSGQLTPGQALQQIEEDVQLGLTTPEQAEILKKDLQVLSRNAPTPTPSPQQEELQKQYEATIPSNDKIDQEAVRFGYPTLDYRSYYKDPKGKQSGITFERWRQLYGPRMSGR